MAIPLSKWADPKGGGQHFPQSLENKVSREPSPAPLAEAFTLLALPEDLGNIHNLNGFVGLGFFEAVA